MICPYCVNDKTQVVGTVKAGTVVERFRRCPRCNKTFQTTEAIKFDSYWGEYARATGEQLVEEQEKHDKGH